jgi:hypothetical protein
MHPPSHPISRAQAVPFASHLFSRQVYPTLQPKRKKSASAQQEPDVEDESMLILEEQPVARGSGEFFYDEGDSYAEFESVLHDPTPAPVPAAPVVVTDDVRVRIEANKRAAEARRAAKAAEAAHAAAIEHIMHAESQQSQVNSSHSTADGEPLQYNAIAEQNSGDQQQHLEQQQPGSCSPTDGSIELPMIRTEHGNAICVEAAETEVAGREGDSVGREQDSMFMQPLRSFITGCSDDVFACMTKRMVGFAVVGHFSDSDMPTVFRSRSIS